MDPTKRDTLTRIFDSARVSGVAYLLILVTLHSTTVKELRLITRESEPTINNLLNDLEARGLAQRSRSGKADHWLPSAAVALAFHQKIFGATSSSSDLDLDLNSDLDQIRSEEDEPTAKIFNQPLQPALLAPVRDEDAEREYRIKCYLSDRHYHLTGEKRAAYVDDDAIYAVHFESWLHQVGAMIRSGVKIKHPAAYALRCCQKGHKAEPQYVDLADRDLDVKLRYFDLANNDDEQSPQPAGADHEARTE